ncbi:MAG: hypothetical protein ACLQIQ_09645 [Beijerinckiaceae bacterium]
MEILSAIADIIRDLLIFVAVMSALFIALIVIVSRMPDTNPLKRVLTALSYRVGATVVAGAVAIPVEPVPGLDMLYDVGVPVLLILYWISFFAGAGRWLSQSPSSRSAPIIEHESQRYLPPDR